MSTGLLTPARLCIPRSELEVPDPEWENGDPDLWGPPLPKAAAEDALDWLEAHGHDHSRVSYVVGQGFRVRRGSGQPSLPGGGVWWALGREARGRVS
jgi:hypothetical protein